MDITKGTELFTWLAEWRGAWAEPWDYTASHGILRIKVARRESGACAVLLLKDCKRVRFATSWDGFNPIVEGRQTSSGMRYRITDADFLDVDFSAILLSEKLESFADIPPRPYELA
jgi:hypothetical protein